MIIKEWISSAATRVTATVNTITLAVTSAYSTLSSAAHTIRSSPSFNNTLKIFGIQFFEGFTRILHLSNLTKLFYASRMSTTLYESFKANVVCYLSLGLLLDVTKNAILARTTSGENTNTDIGIYLTLNSFVMVSMGTLMIHRYYDNTALTMTLTKQASEEVPPKINNSCNHDTAALIKTGIVSPINLIVKLASCEAGSYVPVVKWLTPLGYVYAYGESLAEYFYSGNCTDDKAKKMAKENGYVFGLGASLYFWGEFITLAIGHFTGANSIFISNAIYSALYPWFVTAVLFRDSPVPQHEQGIDFYYYHRFLTDHIITTVGGQILPLLQSTEKKIDWGEMMKSIANSSPSLVIREVLSHDLYEDWSSPNAFILNPTNMMFFAEYNPLLIRELKKIIDIRDKPILEQDLKDAVNTIGAKYVVPNLPNRFTRFLMSDSYKKMVAIVLADWVQDPLKATVRFLEHIQQLQEKSKLTILSDNDPRWQQIVNKETQKQSENSPVIEEVVESNKEIESKAQPVTTSQQGIFSNTVKSRTKMHDFLLDLQVELSFVYWNDKGDRLGFSCVPGTIVDMRTKLSSIHIKSPEVSVRTAFDEVKELFVKYNPKLKLRNHVVGALYRLIIDNIGIIVNKENSPLKDLSIPRTSEELKQTRKIR